MDEPTDMVYDGQLTRLTGTIIGLLKTVTLEETPQRDVISAIVIHGNNPSNRKSFEKVREIAEKLKVFFSVVIVTELLLA